MWPFLVRLFFFLRLRKPVNNFQRWWRNEHKAKRVPLPTFKAPGELEDYIRARFKWRPDGTRLGRWFLPLDYISHPEVFHARILDGVRDNDGDCDDFHAFCAEVLDTMPKIDAAYLHSVVWNGGGHTTALYKVGEAYIGFNYKIADGAIIGSSLAEVADLWADMVLQWAQDKREGEPELRIKFWCLETPDHKLEAVGT